MFDSDMWKAKYKTGVRAALRRKYETEVQVRQQRVVGLLSFISTHSSFSIYQNEMFSKTPPESIIELARKSLATQLAEEEKEPR